MFNRILILCAGNICRSPMAFAFFARELAGKSIEIDSAGIIGLTGEPADQQAVAVMDELGIDISSHVAKMLDERLCQWADIILVMTSSQVKEVVSLYPHAAGKTYRIGHWSGLDVVDPYRKSYSEFIISRDRIQKAVEEWTQKISYS